MTHTNAIRSVKVGNITVNLHNVGYLEVIDAESDDGEATKVPCGCITSVVGTRYFTPATRKYATTSMSISMCVWVSS